MSGTSHSPWSPVAAWTELDRGLRSVAYDVLMRRDGVAGWKPFRAEFRADEHQSADWLVARSNGRLRAVIEHAVATSAYYRECWNSVGFTTVSSDPGEQLLKLPFLTKDVIRSRSRDLVSSDYAIEDLFQSFTGGTTGTQTPFWLDHAGRMARFGRQWGILESCGYRPGDRRALIWGAHQDLPPAGAIRGLKWRFRQYAESQEVLHCTITSDADLENFHWRTRRLRPSVIYGYPSAIGRFADYLVARGIEPLPVRRVITTAERLTDAMRSKISAVFGGEVFNLYCSREHGCVGFECAAHSGFHIDTQSVHLEIVNDGRRANPGELGEIVITDLRNRGMPFIRSRTGDLGLIASEPCKCGSGFPLLRGLDGRNTDFIHLPDGSKIAGLMLTDLFTDIPTIRFAQFVQREVGELEVRIVAGDEFSQTDVRRAKEQVMNLTGGKLRVDLIQVAEIERNPRSGKYREVVSLLEPVGGN